MKILYSDGQVQLLVKTWPVSFHRVRSGDRALLRLTQFRYTTWGKGLQETNKAVSD